MQIYKLLLKLPSFAFHRIKRRKFLSEDKCNFMLCDLKPDSSLILEAKSILGISSKLASDGSSNSLIVLFRYESAVKIGLFIQMRILLLTVHRIA